MKSITFWGMAALVVAVAFVIIVPGWSYPPEHVRQLSLPSGLQLSSSENTGADTRVPPPLPPAAAGGPSAAASYKNVKVLTDVSAAEFMRLQHAITGWVSPKQGCGFCHQGRDYASDAKPTKAVARMMLQMTRYINADTSGHIQPAGVTCYTCHRGKPVPAEIWFPEPAPPHHPFFGRQENWDESADTVRKFFPDDGWSEYFLQDEPIAVQSTTALPSNTVSARVPAKRVYEMMMQISVGMGVNCGFCHNSRALESWDESTPYRWTAYHAIRQIRDLNRNFLLKLPHMLPQQRERVESNRIPVIPYRLSGVQRADGLLICATCHYGQPKPLNGVNMLHDYPGLAAARSEPAATE